jgi:hypothetical protein
MPMPGSVKFILPALAVATIALSAASAQDASRYTMERTDNGYVRLDRMTGEMSICRERDEQMVCQMAADDRRAFEAELDALSDRVTVLEQRLGEGGRDLPSDEEIDRTMGIMEQFMRRFFGLIEEFQRDFGASEPEETVPDRT